MTGRLSQSAQSTPDCVVCWGHYLDFGPTNDTHRGCSVREGLHDVEVAAGLELIEALEYGDQVVLERPGQIRREAFPHDDAQHGDVGRVVGHRVRGHLPAEGAQCM